MEWISVDDAEPENDYKYMVFVDGNIDWFLYCDDGYWCKDYGLVDMSSRVTHWMPHPEFPQNEA